MAYVFSFDERSGIAFSKNAGGAVVPRAGVVGVPFRGAPRLDRGERSEPGRHGGDRLRKQPSSRSGKKQPKRHPQNTALGRASASATE